LTQCLKVALCDDTPEDIFKLGMLLESILPEAAVDCYESGEHLLQQFSSGRYQVVFLDIYMKELTGMETARCLRELDTHCQIVFTTASPDFALESYRVRSAHYLVKPISELDVAEAIARCKELLGIGRDHVLRVTAERREHEIPYDSIFYIEIYNKQCLFHLTQGTITVHKTIDAVERLLPAPPFVRCHRSYIVNLDYVTDVGEDFTMRDGSTVYIRRTEVKRMRKLFFDRLISRTRGD